MGCQKNCKILASQLGFKLGVVRGFQKGITLLEVFIFWVCKNGMPKICKNLAFELRFKLGVMKGFQKGITLGGKGLWEFPYSGVAKMGCKKFAKFLHLSLDSSWGS